MSEDGLTQYVSETPEFVSCHKPFLQDPKPNVTGGDSTGNAHIHQ